MNVQEIISSGILEAYVLGNASTEEIKKIREWEKLYPMITEEIEAIEETLMNHAEEKAPLFSPAFKNKLTTQLFPIADKPEPKIVEFNPAPSKAQNSSNVIRYLAAASIALLIGSSVINVMLYGKLHDAKTELAQLNSEKSVLAGQFKIQQTSLEEKSNQLAMLAKPNNKIVSLKGMGPSPSSSAAVLWNTQDKSVYITIASLPVPPQGKQYQLWALMDGKPVDAGVFTVAEGNNNLMQKMKDMPNAQAFAVTLEKTGGSPTPTMDAMYLIGNI